VVGLCREEKDVYWYCYHDRCRALNTWLQDVLKWHCEEDCENFEEMLGDDEDMLLAFMELSLSRGPNDPSDVLSVARGGMNPDCMVILPHDVFFGASKRLKEDRDFVLRAVTIEGGILESADTFKHDKEVLTVALAAGFSLEGPGNRAEGRRKRQAEYEKLPPKEKRKRLNSGSVY